LIAPLNTRLGWQVTYQRQGVDLPFKWINSTKAGQQAKDDWAWQQPGIYFVGVELFVRLGWSGKARTDMWSKVPDLVLFDEVHRGQNRKSKTHKTLKQVKGGFKLAMSGTPTATASAERGQYQVAMAKRGGNSYWAWVGQVVCH